MNRSDRHSGVISLVLNDETMMNCCGLFDGTQQKDISDQEYERACMRLTPLSSLDTDAPAPYDGSMHSSF